VRIFVLGLLLVACARLPMSAIVPRPWPATATLTALTHAVNTADGYLLGTVAKAEPDELYNDICGVIASVLGRCNGTHAYRLTIRSEQDFPKRIWVFVPPGDTLPLPVGTQAVFLWKVRWVKQLEVCAQRMRHGFGAYCESDQLPTLASLDDVAAPSDSVYIAALFAEKGRRP
jgi:hypothetical protein